MVQIATEGPYFLLGGVQQSPVFIGDDLSTGLISSF
jgi:hypothetical protein